MELSARDRRILAEIECQSVLEDPRWVRRFERLATPRPGRPHASHGLARTLTGTALLLGWTAAVALGSTVAPRPLLWAALGLAVSGVATAALRRLRDRRLRRPARRRLPHIPPQSGRPAEGDGGICAP